METADLEEFSDEGLLALWGSSLGTEATIALYKGLGMKRPPDLEATDRFCGQIRADLGSRTGFDLAITPYEGLGFRERLGVLIGFTLTGAVHGCGLRTAISPDTEDSGYGLAKGLVYTIEAVNFLVTGEDPGDFLRKHYSSVVPLDIAEIPVLEYLQMKSPPVHEDGEHSLFCRFRDGVRGTEGWVYPQNEKKGRAIMSSLIWACLHGCASARLHPFYAELIAEANRRVAKHESRVTVH